VLDIHVSYVEKYVRSMHRYSHW